MASVKFLLNRPKSEKPTSILVRFHSRQTQSITLSTGEMIPPIHWDGQRVSSKYRKQYDRINKHLSIIEADLLDCWRDNKGLTKDELTQLIKNVVRGQGHAQKKTVIEALKKFIAQYEREKESGTVKRYRSLLKKLESFNPNLTFEQLDLNFYDKFKNWLYDNPNPLYRGFHLDFDNRNGSYLVAVNSDDTTHVNSPVGLFDDVVFKYIVNIKTLCAWAEKRGYTVHPSYKEWQIIKRSYPIISLSLDELQRIESLPTLATHLEVARDYFSIACRTGQRISDVKRISTIAITTGSWTINQKKGSRVNQKVINLPLVGFCEPVVEILKKYGGQLPAMLEQNLNKHIKTICKKAGINQEIFIERWAGNKKIRIPGKKYEFLSSHVGKKTFVTILAAANVPLSVIANFTGTSQKTIEKHYLGITELYIAENYLKKVETGQQLRKAQ